MAINYPTDRNEVANRMKADVQNSLIGSNPFLRNSWFGAFIMSMAGRFFDVYYQIKNNLVPNLFPWSATLTYLQFWGGWVGITVKAATQSTGYFTVGGTVGTTIDSGTELQVSDGTIVNTTADATIATVSLSITSLTRSGTLATAQTAAAHSFATGMQVTITGAEQSTYNNTFQITVVDSTHFTFTVTGSPTTPATGTILAVADMASVSVTTAEYGAATAIDAGTLLTFSTPITGIDTAGYVGVDGISGGTDEETTEDYRARVQYRYQNPVTLFNEAAIKSVVGEVAGVTRVWVEQCTPDVGEVTVYFVCDNQSPITPTADQITAVKAAIMAIAPSQVSSDYVHVYAPTLDEIAFTLTALTPNTSTMQAGITANLQQAFKENANVSENYGQYSYISTIYGTVDLNTGAKVTAFTLTAPSGDITVTSGHLPVVGTITYPA